MKGIRNMNRKTTIFVISIGALVVLLIAAAFAIQWNLIPRSALVFAQATNSPVPPAHEDSLTRNLRAAVENPDLDEAERASLKEKLDINQRSGAQQPSLMGNPGPKDQPVPPERSLLPQSETLEVPKDEIIEGSEGVVQAWVAEIQNLWQGQRAGIYYQVLAGASADDVEQGILIVIEVHPGLMNRTQLTYLAPQKTGALRILSVNDYRIELVDQAGNNLAFDLLQRNFVP
jgi:hypothetical protein